MLGKTSQDDVISSRIAGNKRRRGAMDLEDATTVPPPHKCLRHDDLECDHEYSPVGHTSATADKQFPSSASVTSSTSTADKLFPELDDSDYPSCDEGTISSHLLSAQTSPVLSVWTPTSTAMPHLDLKDATAALPTHTTSSSCSELNRPDQCEPAALALLLSALADECY